MECARDRRRREGEDIDLEAQLAQQLLLGDIALLLVHDHEPEGRLRDPVSPSTRCVQSGRPPFPVQSASTCFVSLALRKRLRPSRRSAGSRDSARGRCSSAAGRARSSGRASGSACRSAGDSRLEQRPPSCRTQRRRRRAGQDRPGVFRVFLDLDRHPLVVGLLVGKLASSCSRYSCSRSYATPAPAVRLGVEAEELAGELADALRAPGS